MTEHLLKVVLDELTDTGKSLQGPLMKLYSFARETKNEGLISFLNKEINGYEVTDPVPAYRRTGGQLLVTLQIGIYSDQTEVKEVPRKQIEEQMRPLLTQVQLYEGVAILEKMVAENSKEPYIYKRLPMEALAAIGEAVNRTYISDQKLIPVRAEVRANANIVTQSIQSIRTRLLDFVYEIKDTFGLEISITESNNGQVNQVINHYMTTNIHNTGDGNFINAGDNNHNTVTITVQKGDLASLQKRLAEIGVEKEEIEEISQIVQTEIPEGTVLGPKASTWIGKIYAKALSGAGKIGLGAAGNLVATAVKLYFGLAG